MTRTILLAASLLLVKTAGAQLTGSVPQRFTGTLFDAARASCSVETAGSSTPGTCPVGVCTASFGVRLQDGKLYKLDEGGNTKAAEALRKSRRGSQSVLSYWRSGKASQPVTARISGTLTSETLNVDTIAID
jgi:hypothetical protein